jgi:polysaccharide export outer membrane protein
VYTRQINSRKIYVLGNVKKEGPVPLLRPMTVLQALNEAGGLGEWAVKKKIYVLRKIDGKQVKMPFDYSAVIKGKRLEQNAVLLPDDTIVVP